MRAKKVANMINSVNQQNLKTKNAKRKKQHEIQPGKKAMEAQELVNTSQS
jgi:hypothetical protein